MFLLQLQQPLVEFSAGVILYDLSQTDPEKCTGQSINPPMKRDRNPQLSPDSFNLLPDFQAILKSGAHAPMCVKRDRYRQEVRFYAVGKEDSQLVIQVGNHFEFFVEKTVFFEEHSMMKDRLMVYGHTQ